MRVIGRPTDITTTKGTTMAHTDHARPSRRNLQPSRYEDVTTRRQPRPQPRRQGTRASVVRSAVREG